MGKACIGRLCLCVYIFIWILMGVVCWIAFLKSEDEEIKFGKWGLIVAIPILIPIIVALIIGIFYR
ncbi:hypothetical protein [Nostoc sp.]|uniref:hypothetical protein n=1 Tax=Nostoc sp. TaxID=1180 RepID=UPI002FFB69D3